MTLKEAGVCLIDCDHKTPTAQETGFPYVAIPQLKNGRIDFTDARRISHENLKIWTRKAKPQEDDVVLSRRCNPGETAYVPPNEEFAVGQNLVLLRSDGKNLFPPFLRWLVRSPGWWEQIQKYLNAGAVFDSLKCADIPNFELTIPDFSTQRRITEILSALDEKIELNRQTNATLEAIAQAIFKEWFIDFRFPGTTGEMQYSELGLIPKGWRVFELGELIDSVSVTHCFEKREVIFLNTSDIEAGKVLTHNFSPVEGLPGQAKKSIKKFDILFTEIRPGNKRFALIDFDAEDYVVSTKLMVLRTKADIPPIVVYNFLTSNEILNWLQHLAESRSGTFPQITFDQVRTLKVALHRDLAVKYSSLAWGNFQRVKSTEQEDANLTALRDYLLPRLMNGEIEV
ncbi:MAG: restriction endonuclease subunit S [Candidatus Riflebacteria bacterium]|nr:restriction endonuclease subunit S [Candidatus Riflebacteria bacterium]